MPKALESFTISRAVDGYTVRIELDDGDTTEFTADYEQLELVTEEIGDLLDQDDEGALSVDEDADEPEPEED